MSLVLTPRSFVFVLGLHFHRTGTQQSPNVYHAYVVSSTLGSKDTFTWDEVMAMSDKLQWLESADIEIQQLAEF